MVDWGEKEGTKAEVPRCGCECDCRRNVREMGSKNVGSVFVATLGMIIAHGWRERFVSFLTSSRGSRWELFLEMDSGCEIFLYDINT